MSRRNDAVSRNQVRDFVDSILFLKETNTESSWKACRVGFLERCIQCFGKLMI